MTISIGRSRTRLLVAGTTAAVVAMSGVGVGAAAAEDVPKVPPASALSLVSATNSVTGYRYGSRNDASVEFDLGAHVVAGSDPFEIHVSRKSYKDPIVGSRIVTTTSGKTAVPLPAGMVTDFGPLRKFGLVEIKNAKGKSVQKYGIDFCPNSWSTARTRPDAPATNRYPFGCYASNPFVLGSVLGLQAGWSTPLDVTPGRSMDLPLGKYTVTVTMSKSYVDFFKVAPEQRSLSVALTIVKPPKNFDARRAAKAVAPKASPRSSHGHGQVSDFQPEFRPPARRPATMALADVPEGPRPDLRSLPAWGISLTQGRTKGKKNGKWYVNFGATVWNGGTSPLLVDGFRRTGTGLMDAYQYFFDADGKQVGVVNAGTMEWDARKGHQHWHFTDFAQYRLLAADKKLAVRSGKEAFCLANTDAVDYTLPNAKWRPENTDLDTSCGQNSSVAVREVLDVGSGDTYTQARPGQSFNVTNLPNGVYYIEVMANPMLRLTESSTANNSSLRKITLSGTKKKRKIKISSVHGIKG